MKVLNDLLWDGELKIYQDSDSFKFSIDSILLANFVTINNAVKNILDIGTGNAPIAMMLTKRTNAFITGIEIQKCSFVLADESIKYNKLENQIKIINGDITEIYEKLDNNYYDTIVCNPPYFKSNMVKSINDSKKISRSDDSLSLEDLFKISKKLLKNKGNIAIVIDSNRFIETIQIMKDNSIEPKRIQFVYPKANRNSNIVLIEGTKNGKSGLKVLSPIFLQDENNNYSIFVKDLLENFGK